MPVLSGHPCHTSLPTCVPAALITDMLAILQLLAAVILGCRALGCSAKGSEHQVLGISFT